MTRTPFALLVAIAVISSLAACGDPDPKDNNNGQPGSDSGVGICGNGVTEAGEQCDDGAGNSDISPDACRTDCRLPFCGDGIIDGDEECDDSGGNSDRLPNACRLSCRLPHCGDGVIDPAEACDDGNAAAGDGCGADCEVEPAWACEGVPSVCGCAPYHSGVDCRACVAYVDIDNESGLEDGLTWATAFTRPQPALDAAYQYGPGCEVWVAEGRYAVNLAGQSDTIALRSGVGLYGGFAGDEATRADRHGGTTTFSGEGGPHGLNAYHVMSAVDVTDATVEGLTLQGGYAEGMGLDALGGCLLVVSSEILVERSTVESCGAHHAAGTVESFGGGVYAWGSDLRLDAIYFRNNRADHGGALAAEQSRVVVEGCVFEENEAALGGGAIHEYGESMVVRDCTFTQNRARGAGAIATVGDDTVIERCTFERNEGRDRMDSSVGGAGAVGGSPVRISDCIFHGNLAGVSAGALGLTDGALVERCSFLGNRALEEGGKAGAISLGWGNHRPVTRLESCLIAQNSADAYGGAIVVDTFGQLELVNCTVADNALPGAVGYRFGAWLYLGSDTEAVMANTIVWGNGAPTTPPCDAAATSYSIVEHKGFDGTDGNRSWPPGWPAPLSGTWTAVTTDYVTGLLVLTDSAAAFPPGGLAGAVIHYGTDVTDYTLIEDNTATEIHVRYGAAHRTFVGAAYTIYDYRLPASSPAVDAGQGSGSGFTVPLLDLLGNPRVDDATPNAGVGTPDYVDLGCFERQ